MCKRWEWNIHQIISKEQKVKKVFDFIKCNTLQIMETIALIIAFVVPNFINIQEVFKGYLAENVLAPDNFFYYLAISHGGLLASIIFSIALWILITRKINKDYVMNKIRLYHDYSYGWYWFCAKILGIKQCSLVLVPIFMQFKLVIRGTFDVYPLNMNEFPPIDNEADCKVTKMNTKLKTDEINLILEDTYSIQVEQIPKEKRDLSTIKISRNNGISRGRHFSQKFIESTIDEIRKIKHISMLNIFSTTNPMNTEHIAKRVFTLDTRGNIDHIYVFQQSSDKKRNFENKGHKIL